MAIPEIERVVSPASFPVVATTNTGDEVILLRDKTTSPKLRLISAAFLGATPTFTLNGGAVISENANINFIEGTGVTISIVDNIGDNRADITINSSGDPYFQSNVTGTVPNFGSATQSIMIGDNNTNSLNSGTESIMIGRFNNSFTGTFNETIAIGISNSVAASEVIAIGSTNVADFDYAILIGEQNNTNGIESVAIGRSNLVGTNGVAIGTNNAASGLRSGVFGGSGASATGTDSFQLGTGNNNIPSTLQYLTTTIANADGIQAPTFATAPTTTPVDGALAVDNVANTLYFRSGGAWVAAAGGGGASPLTTKGDLFTFDTGDQRLPVGTDGQVLVANSVTATGLEWQTLTGSAIEVEDEGISLTTNVTKFNFVGAGVTATEPIADEITVTIPGGAALSSTVKTLATDTATVGSINLINGTTTLNLPAGTLDDIVIIADFGATLEASPLTIVPNGAETIQGAANLILNTDNANVQLIFNGTNWYIYGAETFFDAGGGGSSLTAVLKTAATDSATVSAVNIINGTTTLNLPAGSQDDIVIVADIGNTFTASPLTISPDGVETIQGGTNLILSNNNSNVHLIFNSGNWTIFAAETFFDAGGSGGSYTNTESSSGVDVVLTASSDNRQFISPTTNINCIIPDTGIDNTSFFVIVNDDPGSGDIAVKVGNAGNPTEVTLNGSLTYTNAAYTGTNWKFYA